MPKDEIKGQPTKVRVGKGKHEASEAELVPLVDAYEKDDGSTVLVAEMPGAREESIDIRVEKGVLTISAEADVGEFGDEYHRTYTGFVGGDYFRAFALSDKVDRDKIDASYSEGVLTLTLPQGTAAKTHKIEIKNQ